MKRLILLPMILLFIAGCTQMADKSGQAQDETAKQNVELVKKMVQAYENEDLAALKEIYSPDLKTVGPEIDQKFTYDSIVMGNEEWFKHADSIKFDVIYIMPKTIKEGDLAGDWVLLWADISWHNLKAGKTLTTMYHSPMRIEEGKIVYEADYWNEWDVYKQLGAKLKWPAKEEGGMEE